MVEAHDKREARRRPNHTITPATKKGKGAAATTGKIVKKGSPSTSRGDSRSRLEAIREQRKALEKKLAESGKVKGKGKGKGKGVSREVQALKPLPGWEDWAPRQTTPLRRRLDYDT